MTPREGRVSAGCRLEGELRSSGPVGDWPYFRPVPCRSAIRQKGPLTVGGAGLTSPHDCNRVSRPQAAGLQTFGAGTSGVVRVFDSARAGTSGLEERDGPAVARDGEGKEDQRGRSSEAARSWLKFPATKVICRAKAWRSSRGCRRKSSGWSWIWPIRSHSSHSALATTRPMMPWDERLSICVWRDFLFSYWVDHASREVRISEIIRV